MGRQNRQQTTRLFQILQALLRSDPASGGLLLLAMLGAILMANGPMSIAYQRLHDFELTLTVGTLGITESARAWINDTLMAIFFLSVGLETKRELVAGSLRSV